MKIPELLESTNVSKPIVFVDMDGVLADLYNHAATLHDVDHYNSMTPEQWESFFKNSNAYHLFRDIRPFPTANKLLSIVKRFAGGYTILSSPLNFDKAGSIKGKREWLKKHIRVAPDNIVFEHDKYKYAVQPDGTPNILIDDYGVNVKAWRAAGGIAIKYQADENDLGEVTYELRNANNYINQNKKDK
jgi:5'(3')-deoxyribonucleotidase